MARRQQHSFTPPRAAIANTEGEQAVASVSAQSSHQDTHQPKSRAIPGHSDALSYRAVAARAVDGCSASRSTPPSVQGVVVSQSCGGKCETQLPRPAVDSDQPVASRAQAADADMPLVTRSQRFPAAPDNSLNPAEPCTAPLASGSVSGGTAREKFCTYASLTVAARSAAASTGQVPAKKKTKQKDHCALRQPKQQSSDRTFAALKVSHSHLIAGADSGTAQLQMPLSTTPGSTSPLGMTQERGSSRKQGTRPIPTKGVPAVEVLPTREDGSRTITVASPDTHIKGKRLEGSLRAKKKKQQQQRQKDSAQHGVTEQHSQQNDLTDRQPRHHAQQLPQQSGTADISFEQGKEQQLLAHQQQNQQKLKQHRSRPVLVKRQHNGHREDGPAKQSFVLASFDGGTSDASEGIDGGISCWSVKKGTLPGKGGSESQQHPRGRGEGPSNSTIITDNVPQEAYTTNCGKTGASYTSYGTDKAKVRQQHVEESNDRSQIACCSYNISSGSSTCSSSASNGRSDTSSSSISSNCITSCTSASRSGNGSCSGGIPSSTSTPRPCNGSTSDNTNVGVAAILHHTIQRRENDANIAPAVHSGRQASYKVGLHQSTYIKSNREKTKDELRQPSGGTTAGQQNNADHEMLPSSKGYCSHNRQDSRHHRASPVFGKHMNNKQGRVATLRQASACGRHRQPSNGSSSSRCISMFQPLSLADSIDGLHAGVDVDADNCITPAAGTYKARSSDGRPQFAAATSAVFPLEIGMSHSTSAFMAESAANASLGDRKREHEINCKQRGSTIHNRRGRSTSCAGSMPREQSNTTAADPRLAPTTRVNPAAAKAAPCDIRFLVRESIGSSSTFPSTVGACTTASAAAGTTAALVPIASTSGCPAGVSPSPGTSSSVHAEISMSPDLGTSLRSASSKMPRSSAALDMKCVARGQKRRTPYQSTNTPTVLKPERHQNVGAVASGVLSLNSSPRAAIKGDGKMQYSVHSVQSNDQCLTTSASPALEAPSTSMCRPADDTYSALPKSSLNSAKRRPASTVTSAALTVGAAVITTTISADKNIMKTAASQRSDERDPAGMNGRNKGATPGSYARTVESHLRDSSDKCDTVEPSVADDVSQRLTTFSWTNAKGNTDAEKDDLSAVLISALSSSEVHKGAAIIAASVPANVIPSGPRSASAAEEGKDTTECQTEKAPMACECAESIEEGNLEQTLTSYKPTSTTTERMSLLLPDGSLNLQFFKVFPCKNRNSLHEKKVCPHYHNSRDRRRAPVTYRAEQCEEHFDLDTASVQCSKGEACFCRKGNPKHLSRRCYSAEAATNRTIDMNCSTTHTSTSSASAPACPVLCPSDARTRQTEPHGVPPCAAGSTPSLPTMNRRRQHPSAPKLERRNGNVYSSFASAASAATSAEERGNHPNARNGMTCFIASSTGRGCLRGVYCAFAHSREEIRASLFTEEEERNPDSQFFVNKFKTIWCPYGSQHDWRTCVYAHTYQDCRRSPLIGYGSEPCAAWNKDLHSADYEKRCPHGARCSFSHGSKEQLYHPSYYKTMPCIDYRPAATGGSNNRGRAMAQQSGGTAECAMNFSGPPSGLADAGGCPRGFLCAFYHEGTERRVPIASHFAYAAPLAISQLKLLQPLFLKPPLFNLDDFEAFGHTSRQTAALRRSQALNNTQGPGKRETLKQGLQAATTAGRSGGAIANNEVALCLCTSTKLQYRSNCSHRVRAAVEPRFREIGTLSSPQETKWLSNSSPPYYRPAESTQASFLAFAAGSARTGVPSDASAAAATRDVCPSMANATDMEGAVTATLDTANSSALARAVTAILPGRETGVPHTSEQKHSKETLSPAGGDFDSSVHHTNQVDSSSRSSDVKKETASAAVRGEEAYSLPADTIQALQGSSFIFTSCSRSAQQQREHTLQYELQPEGLVEGQWHEREQQEDPSEAQHELRSQWQLQRHQLQGQPQEQHEKQQEIKAQISETIAKTIYADDCTERRKKDLRSAKAAEVAVAARVHIIKARERGHVFAGDQSAAIRATSCAAKKRIEQVTDFRTEKETSTGARRAGAAGDGARAAEAREAAGGTMEAVTSLAIGRVGAAARLASADRYTEAKQQTAMPPPTAALLIENSTPAYACGGSSQVACLLNETPGETRRLGPQEVTHFSPLPEYSNLSQHFVSLQETLNDHWGCLSYEQPFQTIASMQEQQSDRGELQHSQPRGQYEQGLLQRRDHHVAAASSTDQHASFPASLRRWNPHVTNIPVSTNDLQNASNPNECVQDSMRAAAASAFDQSPASKTVNSAIPPANQQDASRSEVLKQDMLLHMAPERRAGQGVEVDSTGVKEHANGVSGSSSDADHAKKRAKDYITGRIEGCGIAGRDAVSSRSLARAAEAAASRWRGSYPGLPTQQQTPVLLHQVPGATLGSPGTKGENHLKATSSRTEDTFSDPSCQPQQSHCRVQDTREQDNCRSQSPVQHKLGSTGNTRNCVNSSDIDGSNCSSNKASASGHNHTNGYNSNDNKRQGAYNNSSSSVLGISECSGHTSSRTDSSRAGSVSGRKFVGLFNNGWVWQVPFSGNVIGENSISLCAAAGSDRNVFNCDSRIPGTSDAACSLVPSSSTFSNICDKAGSGALDTEASRGYSLWVTTSLASDKYSLPASSPAFLGTGQTPWSAATAATGDDIDKKDNAKYSHVSQLRTAAPFQCRSSSQLFTEDVGVCAVETHTIGPHASALAALEGDFHALHPAHNPGALGAAEKPIEAGANTGVFATSRMPAAAGAAARAEGKPEVALEQVVSDCLKRSECETASKFPSHLLRRSLQRPMKAPQQHTPCAYQQQLVSGGTYSRSLTTLRTGRHNHDTHLGPESTAMAAGIGVIGAASWARTGDPSSFMTRTLTENAAAFPSLGCDLRLTQNSARPTDTAVFTDEHRSQYPSIAASAAEPSGGAGNPFSGRESAYESSSNSFATDHGNCGSVEHSGNGKGINSTSRRGRNKCRASNSSYGLSILDEDNSPSHNNNRNHKMHNYTQPLSAGGPSLWGCAVYAVGDSAATERLGESVFEDTFASSAPPRLYYSGYDLAQRQERRQQGHHSEELLQKPQQRHEEKYALPSHLLRPRFHPQQQEQQGIHLCCYRLEDTDQHENPQQQPKFLQISLSPHSERRSARDQLFLPPRTLHEEHKCQDESGFDGRYCYGASREDVSAAAWLKPRYELWDRMQDEPGACSARSQSEQGAAAAAAVLNLLDDDERFEQLRQQEELILSASNSAVGKNDILPPAAASAALPASTVFSSLGVAVTDSRQATARGSVSLLENSVPGPIGTGLTIETPRETGLPHAQAPLCLARSANETCRSLKDLLAWTESETDRDASFPSEVTSEPQHHCAGGDNNPIYPTDDARAEAALTGAATTNMESRTASEHERGVAAKDDFTASHRTVPIFTVHPASSRGVTDVSPGLRAAPTAARTIVGGPLVIGTGTPLDQQQLLLSLLRLQLWEKLFVIMHPTAASSPDATHSNGSQQTVQCARRPHSVGTTESAGRVEEGRAEVTAAAGAPDCGSAALVAEPNQLAGEVAEARMADAPTGGGLAGAAGQNGGEVLEETSAAKIPADVVSGNRTTAIEGSIAAVEEEAALLAKTAEKAHYSCKAGFIDKDDGFQPTGRRSALVALEAAGLRFCNKSEHPGDPNDGAARADRAACGMQPRALGVLTQQLFVLTQAPQRLPRQHSANKKQAGEPIQERWQQTEGHRKDRQHLKTHEKMEVDNGEERVSTLSPDALTEPERSLLAVSVDTQQLQLLAQVIHLHRTPSELNQWFSRLHHQRVHRETSTYKAVSCNDDNNDCHTSSRRGSAAAGFQAGNATLCTLESVQETCQTQAGVTEVEEGTTDHRGGAETLPQGAPATAGVRSQVVVDPPVTAVPPEAARAPLSGAAVRKQMGPSAGTTTAALTHAVVLHIVCNCHSSLNLLSHLTSEQQERCFFPQAHELPLWFAFLHCASRQWSSPLRRGRSVHRILTSGSRNVTDCACSSTSRNSTGSDTATSASLLVAGSPLPPSTPPAYSFDTASVQSETSSAATAANSVGTSAPSSTNVGDGRPSSDLTGTSTRSPEQRSIHTHTNPQSWQMWESDVKTLQVPHNGTIVTERSATGHSLPEQSAARTATATPTTSCLAVLPVFPSISEAKTKKLAVGCDVAALLPPVGVPRVCARSSADDSRSGVSVSAEASGGLAKDGAPASIESTLSSSYVFEPFPGSRTSDSSYKDRSPKMNHTSERNRSIALPCAWSTVQKNDSNTDSDSSRNQCISSHARKMAYSLDCQRVWMQHLGQEAKKSKLLLTLMLLKELREAKAVAATLLHTLQASEVLLCVCCCYNVDHKPLQQHSFKQSAPSNADHNAAPDRREGPPVRQLNARAITRSSAADSSQHCASLRSISLAPRSTVWRKCQAILNGSPDLQARAATGKRYELQQHTSASFSSSKKPQMSDPRAHSFKSNKFSEGGDLPCIRRACSTNSPHRRRSAPSSSGNFNRSSARTTTFSTYTARRVLQTASTILSYASNLQDNRSGPKVSATAPTIRGAAPSNVEINRTAAAVELQMPTVAASGVMGSPTATLFTANAAFPVKASELRKITAPDVKVSAVSEEEAADAMPGETAEEQHADTSTKEDLVSTCRQHSEKRFIQQLQNPYNDCLPLTWGESAAANDAVMLCTVTCPKVCSVSLKQLVTGCLAEEALSLPLLQLLVKLPLQSTHQQQQQQWVAAIPPDAWRGIAADGDGNLVEKGVPGMRAVDGVKGAHYRSKSCQRGLSVEHELTKIQEISDSVTARWTSTSSRSTAVVGLARYEQLWCILCGKHAATMQDTASSPPSKENSIDSNSVNSINKICTRGNNMRINPVQRDVKNVATSSPLEPLATMCCLVRRKLNNRRFAMNPKIKVLAKDATLQANEAGLLEDETAQYCQSEMEADKLVLELVCPHAFHLRCVNEVLLPVLGGRCICQLFVPPSHWRHLRPADTAVRDDIASRERHRDRCSVTGTRCCCCGSRQERSIPYSRYGRTSFDRTGSGDCRQMSGCSKRFACSESSSKCCRSSAHAASESYENRPKTADLMHPYCSQASQSTAYSNSGRKSSSDSREGQVNTKGSCTHKVQFMYGERRKSDCSGDKGANCLSANNGPHSRSVISLPAVDSGLTLNLFEDPFASFLSKSAASTNRAETFRFSVPSKDVWNHSTSRAGIASAPASLPCNFIDFASASASSDPSAIGRAVWDSSGTLLDASVAVKGSSRAAQLAASDAAVLPIPSGLRCKGEDIFSGKPRGETLPPSLTTPEDEAFCPRGGEHRATNNEYEKDPSSRVFFPSLTAAAARTVAKSFPVGAAAAPSYCCAPFACSSEVESTSLPPGLPKLLGATLEAFARLQQTHAALLLQTLHLHKQKRHQLLREGEVVSSYSEERLVASETVEKGSDCLYTANSTIEGGDCHINIEQPVLLQYTDNHEKGKRSITTYASPRMNKYNSSTSRNCRNNLKRSSRCVAYQNDDGNSKGGIEKGLSHSRVAHDWGVSPDNVQLMLPLVASAAACTSVKVYLKLGFAARWSSPILEPGLLPCYGSAAARIILFLLQGREACRIDRRTFSSRFDSFGSTGVSTENLQNSGDLPSSDCLRGSSRGSDGGCTTSGETGSENEAERRQDSNISANHNTCERSGNHCSRCNWSSSNHSSRSNRWRISSSSKFMNEITAHRFSHSSANAGVYASENVASALHLESSERAAAEICPPLLRHLLLLLAGCRRCFGQEAKRSSFWLSYVNRADVNLGRGRAGASGEQTDVMRVAEALEKTYSASQRSGTGQARFSVADAISASAVDADAARDGYTVKEPRDTQLLDGLVSSPDSVTLSACVQHPFFWDAAERADLLDCCATFFNLHASPPARNGAAAEASATNRSCASAAALIDLRKREEEAEVVSTAMAAAEHMASGWRGRLDVQLLRALGEAGLPRRTSNVESLLDFLRILRFAWSPWILNLSVEHLENLAHQYAATPLSRGLDPSWSLRFWLDDAACPYVSLHDAAAARIPADPTAVMQEKTAHAKYWSAERSPSVSASEKCECVELAGVCRDVNAASAGPDTQARKALGEVRYHACCRKLTVASLDKQAEAAASDLIQPGGIRCTSDSAHVGKHDCEADQQQNRGQQLPTQVLEAGEVRRAFEKKWIGVEEEHCCQPPSTTKKVDNLQGGPNESCGNHAAQQRKRRRLLRKTLIELRDDVLLRQLNSVHPELFLLFCVIAGSSGSSSMIHDSYAHKAGSAGDDSISQRNSDVGEAYQVFDTHPKLAALRRLFGCCEYLPQYSNSNTPTCTWFSLQDSAGKSMEKKSPLSSTHSRKRSL